MFGYKPPARLDFAYCKMSFLNDATIPEASDTVAATEQLKASEGSSSDAGLLLGNKIQELNLMEGKLGPLEESDEEEDQNADKKEEQVKTSEQNTNVEEAIKQEIEPVKEQPTLSDRAPEKEVLADNQLDGTNEENKPQAEDSNPKLMNFLVIHGGMDTEGNVYDDCFFIHLLG